MCRRAPPSEGRAVRGGLFAPAQATHALSAGESTWLAALPCALLVLLAIVVLGPPLGDLVFQAPPDGRFWSMYMRAGVVRPEPTEHARFLIALTGPLLLSGATLVLAGPPWCPRRRCRSPPPRDGRAAAGPGFFFFFFRLLVALFAQERHVYEPLFTQGRYHEGRHSSRCRR